MTYIPQLNISRTHSEALLGDPYLPQAAVDVTADAGLDLSDVRIGAGGFSCSFWDAENRITCRLSVEPRGGSDWGSAATNAVARYISDQGRRTYTATSRAEAREILERLDGELKAALRILADHDEQAAIAAAAEA